MVAGTEPGAVTVGLAQLTAPAPAVVLERVLETLPAARRGRLLRLRLRADIERGALGDVLARLLVADRIGSLPSEVTVLRRRSGAPRVRRDRFDLQPPHISISHAGRWVACAVSDAPTGVDVEVVRPLSRGSLLALLPPASAGDVLLRPEPARHRHAIRLWTAIESYLKMLKVGLAVDPREVRLMHADGPLIVVWAAGLPQARVHTTDLDDQHVLAVCRPGRSARRIEVSATSGTEVFQRYLDGRQPTWRDSLREVE